MTWVAAWPPRYSFDLGTALYCAIVNVSVAACASAPALAATGVALVRAVTVPVTCTARVPGLARPATADPQPDIPASPAHTAPASTSIGQPFKLFLRNLGQPSNIVPKPSNEAIAIPLPRPFKPRPFIALSYPALVCTVICDESTAPDPSEFNVPGANEQDALAGSPAHVKLTLPTNPGVGVIVNVA